jgi:hypothetical protein
MRGKKLLTLGCVVAILACGACFLPPPRPVPPPLAPALRASRRIRVEVVNLSPTQHIAPQRFGSTLMTNINNRLSGTRLKATTDAASRPGDAVLHIDILQESASAPTPSNPGRSMSTFSVAFNGSFIAANGDVLRRASNRTFSSYPVYIFSDSDPWRDSVLKVEMLFTNAVLKEFFSAP